MCVALFSILSAHPPTPGAWLLLLVHNFRVNDRAFVFLAAFGFGACLRTTWLALRFAGAGLFARRLIKFSGDSLPGFVKFVVSGADGRHIAALQRFTNFFDRVLNFRFVGAGYLVGAVFEH